MYIYIFILLIKLLSHSFVLFNVYTCVEMEISQNVGSGNMLSGPNYDNHIFMNI